MVYIWNASSRQIEYKLPGHLGSVNDAVFHPKEPIVASASSDKQIYLGELSKWSWPLRNSWCNSSTELVQLSLQWTWLSWLRSACMLWIWIFSGQLAVQFNTASDWVQPCCCERYSTQTAGWLNEHHCFQHKACHKVSLLVCAFGERSFQFYSVPPSCRSMNWNTMIVLLALLQCWSVGTLAKACSAKSGASKKRGQLTCCP